MSTDAELSNLLTSNKQNKNFYSDMPIEYFNEVVKKTGLIDCCDISNIESYILRASAVLDVGAGCGRCIPSLFNINPSIDYMAVERNKPFLDKLLEDYSSKYKLDHFFGDIFDFKSTRKFDLILLMFSTISEFNYTEQDTLLQKLSSLLEDGGVICVDLVSLETFHPVGDVSDSYIDVKTPYGCNHFYILDDEELDHKAAKAGFKLVAKKNYQVMNNMDRRIFIFKSL